MSEYERITLPKKRVEQLKKQPIVETFIRLSNDGDWVLHETRITDIKSRNYYDKVFEP